MKKGKLSDFYTNENEQSLLAYWDPLFKAMAAGIKELEVTPEEFLKCMRWAVTANVYHHVIIPFKIYKNGLLQEAQDYPTILAMRITIV